MEAAALRLTPVCDSPDPGEDGAAVLIAGSEETYPDAAISWG